MDLPPELLIKIFEFLAVSSSSQQLLVFTRLALVNRLWGSVAVKFLYTYISHQSWKLRRVSRCLETLSLQRDTLSAFQLPGKASSLIPDPLSSSLIRRTSAESDRSTLQTPSPHHDTTLPEDPSILPPILGSPAGSNMLAATVTHLYLRIWSPDSDNTLSQLLLSALTNTINLATLSLSTSEMFAQHFELLLLRKGIIALESPSEPQPTLITRSFLPCLTSIDVWPGFRLFQLASGRPVRNVSSSTHITGDALKHLVPFFQRSLGPVQKVHFNVTARDTNAVADILRIIAWKLPCLVEVFFNVFVTKRGNSPKYSHDLLELLAPLSALQTVEILLSRHARSPEPDPYLYQHFAALHSLKATAPNAKHVVLDTIRWLYTSSTPAPLSTRDGSPKSSSQRQHHSSMSSSTPPPISPLSATSISHSPPSSSGPSTPPSTGIGMSASSNPTVLNPSSDTEQEHQQQDERHQAENVSIISSPPLVLRGNSLSTSSSHITSLLDSSIDKQQPAVPACSPPPYNSTSTSSFHHSPEPTQNPLPTPVTPSTPRTHFPQTPITPGSFGAPDADLDSSPPSYTGWSPLPSDPRTHMWWLSTYGNAVDARLAMCAMWGSILGDSESDATDTREQNNSDALGVIPPLEEIGYMFGVDLASAGTPDMFAVEMHSNDPYPDQTDGRFEIEELS